VLFGWRIFAVTVESTWSIEKPQFYDTGF